MSEIVTDGPFAQANDPVPVPRAVTVHPPGEDLTDRLNDLGVDLVAELGGVGEGGGTATGPAPASGPGGLTPQAAATSTSASRAVAIERRWLGS